MVLYVTSVQMVRSTRDLCKQVAHILKAYRVRCSVKDVYLHPAYGKELSERLGGRENVSLPQASCVASWDEIMIINVMLLYNGQIKPCY